uniref:Uncharacterized protein n=2 Tax=Rhodnius prolixus TaxID=13249 RepID=T1HRG2_RHOPR
MYLKLIICFYTIFTTIVTLKADFKLTVLHTNDMHSRIEEISRTTSKCNIKESCYGGFARVAYEVRRIKAITKNTLFLNAGDNYQGSPLFTYFKWEILVPLLRMLGIDVMSLGNHEFDNGVSGLVPFLQQIEIPVVTCNLNTSAAPALTIHTALKPWHMLTVDGVKIGVIGYLTPDTKFLASTGNVTFFDEIDSIKKYAEIAKLDGADLIFAVGHSGIKKDVEIAKKVSEVDLVVGGHTDTFLYTGTPPDIEVPYGGYPLMIEQHSGKKVPVVQAYGYTKYLGKLDLVWDDKYELVTAKGNPILLNSAVAKEPNVESEILIWKSKLDGKLELKIGAAKVFLDGLCRLKECNFGNFVTDAITHFVVKNSNGITWTEAPIIVFNGGAIRTSIAPTESVTWSDLMTALPFENQLVRLRMKGSTLLKALERSVESYDVTRKTGFGGFLQVSGLKVEYAQSDQGKLVVRKALSRCGNCTIPFYSEIDPNKEYSVVTTYYVSNGGDGYYMFKNDAQNEHVYEEIDLHIVANYLEMLSPIYPGIEGRIIIPNELTLPPAEHKSTASMATYS